MRPVAVGSRAQFRALDEVVERHRIRPVIDRSFPFDRAVDAFRYYASGSAFGKVVIELPPLAA
ncbi:zinc-binding dehydrogenase [Kitasatospora saccharophila]|uniref:zinc-binding dehydrogenase n=1 Tax=Kitasatospora saccharophila TaxID=407973 RepID=UPI0031D743DE